MLKLGVDVGGTFTDVLVLAEDSDELTIAKVLSTPDDQSAGVIAGIAAACEKRGISPSELELILHGSTVVTNMILESKGAAGGLVTTAGHEQVLHLARAWTPGPLYGWMGMEKPPPLVPLWRTKPVVGRLSATGEEVEPLDEAAVKTAVEELLADGVESLTISLLNSYVNPVHERRARELAREVAPDMPVSIASDLVSEYREYERTLTAVLNSYVQPQVIKYLDHLESQLDDQGFAGRLNIVRSDGGTMSAKATKDKPVDIAFSGPSGGAVGASYVARMIDVPNVLTFDMGGTSTDVALCNDGEVASSGRRSSATYQFQARTARHPQRRRGRRLDRLPEPGRRAACGTGERRRRSRPGLLRAGGRGADRDRRQRGARTPPRRLEAGRLPGARRRSSQDGRGQARQGPRHRRRRRRAGGGRHRQREHARGTPRGQRRARLRPARTRPGRLRRCRAASRERAAAPDRCDAADRAGLARACSAPSASSPRTSRTSSPRPTFGSPRTLRRITCGVRSTG